MTSVRKQTWDGPSQRVDTALAELGLARSRNHAASLVRYQRVRIGNKLAKKPSQTVPSGSVVTLLGGVDYVSRSAVKLVAALQRFAPRLKVADKLALDVGASTGGFTQVLLEAGAREVIALDVGHGQLDPLLRNDPRVRVVEGCNARYLDRETLTEVSGTDAPVDVVVGDVSFISLTKILPALAAISHPGTQCALLVKPQFEVGKETVHNGVVRSRKAHADALTKVIAAALTQGFYTIDITVSPIEGSYGNREFLIHLARESQSDRSQWKAQIAERVQEITEGSGT